MTLAMRPATAEDRDFLAAMLAEAVNWTGDRGVTADLVWDRSDLARYVEDWPRTGEIGIVAEYHGSPVGAVWLRYLTAERPGYGYLGDDIPELTMAVIPTWRGQGVGKSLLQEMIAAATDVGMPAISLSVERANYARHLYDEAGFVVAGKHDDADTMVKDLAG